MKEVKYNYRTKEFVAYLDGRIVGYYRSAQTAENELNRLRYEELKRAAYVEKLEELRRAA